MRSISCIPGWGVPILLALTALVPIGCRLSDEATRLEAGSVYVLPVTGPDVDLSPQELEALRAMVYENLSAEVPTVFTPMADAWVRIRVDSFHTGWTWLQLLIGLGLGKAYCHMSYAVRRADGSVTYSGCVIQSELLQPSWLGPGMRLAMLGTMAGRLTLEVQRHLEVAAAEPESAVEDQ